MNQESNTDAKMTDELPPEAILLPIIGGAIMTQAVGVAARLNIADLLKEGEKSITELARLTSSHERSLYRVLRSLAGSGIFQEIALKTFANTPVSELLRADAPNSMRNTAIFLADPWHYNVWGEMPHSVRTGEAVWKKTHGADVFDWLAENPAEAELFNNAMTDFSAGAAPAVIEAYDFSGFKTLADIAGGHGILLAQILKANPDLKGILFDTTEVIAGAASLLEKENVSGRVEMVTGDFFAEVPSADAYIMKHIIHDWDDRRAVLILKNIRRAMTGDGKVLLVESVVPPGNDPHPSKLFDLEMLTATGGTERTEAEYGELFTAAGFRLTRVIPTKSPFSIIEAIKAQ